MTSATRQQLRTEVLHQRHTHVILPLALGLVGTLVFYIMSPLLVPEHFAVHLPTLMFIWMTFKRSTSFSITAAISMGCLTEILLSMTIGSGVFTYLFSYAALRFIEPLWDLHYGLHKIGYGIVFMLIWHSIFWFMY